MSAHTSDVTLSPLRSRRWEPGGQGIKAVSAGVECGACGVECEAVWATHSYRCPKCGATAPGCRSNILFKVCALLAGHDGEHESPSGTGWRDGAR